MWRCEDVSEGVRMWRWADVKMRRCEHEQMWSWEDVKMWGCEDVRMWGWEDVKMWGCEDEKMWRCEDVKMRRCEYVKNVWQAPTIRRTLRSDALGKNDMIHMTRYGDMKQHDTIWRLVCDAIGYDLIECDTIWSDMTQFDIIWYVMIHDACAIYMIRSDVIWYMIWFDEMYMIWYDTTSDDVMSMIWFTSSTAQGGGGSFKDRKL
jgi:hypothetical protein